MYRKLLVLFLIAGSLGLVLFVKTFLFEKPKNTRLIDRLPTADFLGRANILELAKESSALLQFNKLSIRDFTTYEFLLGQAKQYGVDFESDSYIFVNENRNWGVLMPLSDSSKVKLGIQRISKYNDLEDSIVGGNKYYFIEKEKSFLHYGKDYLLLYQGTDFLKTLNHVVSAHFGDQLTVWKKFLNQKQFKNEHLVFYANWPELQKYDVEMAMFAHDSDSLSLQLKSYFKKRTPLHIALKSDGVGYKSDLNADHFIDIHLDINEFRKHTQDSVYVQLLKLSKKVGFPFERFLSAWNGDLVYQEGGREIQQQTYIETILDEDFNETEIEKIRYDTVIGFSVLSSFNENAPQFIGKLTQKGLLRRDNKGFRFLFSPLLNFKKTGPIYQYFSAATSPALFTTNLNQVIWKYKGTRYYFKIDNLTRYEVYGTLKIPIKSILKRNKLI